VRVVVVDDSPISAEAVVEMVEMHGHEVVGFSADGAGALAVVRSSSPDVVLVDYRLGDEKGTDVVKALRAENPDLLAVVMSMGSVPGFDLRSSGATCFVQKEELLTVDLESLIGLTTPSGQS
jgi:DNA-binding NarL/FixJ family response regulator